jgi:hypothetical protein
LESFQSRRHDPARVRNNLVEVPIRGRLYCTVESSHREFSHRCIARIIVEKTQPYVLSQVAELRRAAPLLEGNANSGDRTLPVVLSDSIVDASQDGFYLFLCPLIGALRSTTMNISYGTPIAESSRSVGPIQMIQGPASLRDRLSALLDDFVKT